MPDATRRRGAGWLLAGTLLAASGGGGGNGTAAQTGVGGPPADDTAHAHAEQLLEQGRAAFRHDTFGSEVFWGDTLQLHGGSPRSSITTTRSSRSASIRERRAISSSTCGRSDRAAARCVLRMAYGRHDWPCATCAQRHQLRASPVQRAPRDRRAPRRRHEIAGAIAGERHGSRDATSASSADPARRMMVASPARRGTMPA